MKCINIVPPIISQIETKSKKNAAARIIENTKEKSTPNVKREAIHSFGFIILFLAKAYLNFATLGNVSKN